MGESATQTKTIPYEFDFSGRLKTFELTEEDYDHAWKHRLRMMEWSGPGMMNALSGVDWDKVLSHFPYYSLRCQSCDWHGGDYESNGQLRESSATLLPSHE